MVSFIHFYIPQAFIIFKVGILNIAVYSENWALPLNFLKVHLAQNAAAWELKAISCRLH